MGCFHSLSHPAAATILNAANEVAVDAFLAEQIGFLEIANIVEETMGNVNFDRLESIDDVFHLDATARNVACVETEKPARIIVMLLD